MRVFLIFVFWFQFHSSFLWLLRIQRNRYNIFIFFWIDKSMQCAYQNHSGRQQIRTWIFLSHVGRIISFCYLPNWHICSDVWRDGSVLKIYSFHSFTDANTKIKLEKITRRDWSGCIPNVCPQWWEFTRINDKDR